MNNIRPISFNRLPPATRWLILSCGTGYALQLVFGGAAINGIFGLVPARVINDGWIWQAASYMFLHGGLFHLLFNMLMLWMFGRIIEAELGQKEFIKYFFITGIGAAFFSVLFSYNSHVPVIGASGAIYGLLMAFALLYPKSTVYLYFMFPITARQMVIMFVVLEFIAGFSGRHSGIANFAHLGGMLTGYLYLRWWPVFKSGRRETGDAQAPRQSASSRSAGTCSARFPFFGQHHDRGYQPPPEDAQSAEEDVNRILDKIIIKGIGSLTEEERFTMKKYSKRVKK